LKPLTLPPQTHKLRRSINVISGWATDAKAYCNLGVAYDDLGRYQDAIEPYKQAIRIQPDFVLAHYNLGVAYSVASDKNSALEEYKILKTMDAEKANELFKLISK
jgi:tetratricopeptide (TPR) repeat protein